MGECSVQPWEEKLFRLISHEGVVELCVPSVCDLMDGGQRQLAERQLTDFVLQMEKRWR